jgi:hypothetical protein
MNFSRTLWTLSQCLHFLGRNRSLIQPITPSILLRRDYIAAGDLRGGDIVNLSDGKIYLVTKSIFHTWGRGGSFVNLDFKDIKTGAKKSERYRTADTMERK